ncbi:MULTISPECIES: b(o/a)3-type cytochrome-c oxidase subunit 1 [Allobacillus]|uniref:B(O/a)3-type cytochrome-c oxidase subunit 1 n=1 Tax=Allobacillus halotolerans TaxID=570278 RepID=A0ABS6GRJ4_9BACI|nr:MULTISPECIES: b(o/a)3-type cytochrome-c oxidase subunit 1 [Allobacillus]MBU6081724.1 b(o/a)3-type cytochrome-c oxidase subunit 1 [Allobacillus halotolerans]TSJ66592.1 b(o/a)3-type cytochrome-c oxidase subunit 1 [Allobacillus sp. SKP2-8]
MKINRLDARLSLAHFYVAFGSILFAGLLGLLQTLVRSELITLPSWINYYQILTGHGVVMALVFTTYFIFGFFYASVAKSTGEFTNKQRKAGWIGFWLLTGGLVLAALMIALNKATVLYTFYAPLQASPFFYIALALIIIGTYFGAFAVISRYRLWKKEHPGEKTPLLAYMAVATLVLWLIATIGVVAAVLFQFLPWAFGWTDTINVALTRTLFWYFGHPLVYFWLLPAYMAWYVMVPKIIGGKVFSDQLARFSFVLFILFSIPVGFHHQLLESGIGEGWKFFQVILTFAVILPSLMTAFALFSTFEIAGRQKGGKGLFGWFKKLPWGDVRFLAPFMGMLIFIPAGAGGIINASHQLNQIVHNTIWVTGHFHITVGGTVAVTFFGISYWIIPHLKGRILTKKMNKIGIYQTVLWAVGMGIMSSAMHISGLLGNPRRTQMTSYNGHEVASSWGAYEMAHAVGGTLLVISLVLFVIVLINLAFFAPKGNEEFPIAEELNPTQQTPNWLENWKLWIGIVFALIFIAYTLPIIDIINNSPPGSSGFKYW